MCIIIDANSAHEVVNLTEDGKPVLHWLLDPKQRAGLILGGKLSRELDKAGFRSTLLNLSRVGRLHRVDDEILSQRVAELEKQRWCKSNDLHVVALSMITKCKLVFSKDKLLHVDLKNFSKYENRISIYQNSSHFRLLQPCECL